ncbi:hypothetical protein [Mucilaginibacter sp.]|uniref:hypothetical protein n=1 Tax=Mucilaginibacter sp. TaxID=1882438 RepID=UPI0025F46386|nr:hypothetical protein [Mucilaginibacter sp.]
MKAKIYIGQFIGIPVAIKKNELTLFQTVICTVLLGVVIFYSLYLINPSILKKY